MYCAYEYSGPRVEEEKVVGENKAFGKNPGCVLLF